ncbi:MAG: serine/threonine protein kinase [Deltaproteobacteria bacterium]|nr:serine/threonine protein kinase [Deltaproteobacteria bacterium]
MASPDRYELIRQIGSGGAAEVFEANLRGESGFSRRVAVKRLLAVGDARLERSFLDEARIASALHHANIVSAIDFGVSEGVPFLVTELVDGLDLESLFTGAARLGEVIPPELALYVTSEVACALDYAHQANDAQGRPMGVVHRDVSPENVLVSWQGEVKLTDFGIAFAARRLEHTVAGVAKGKQSYMAPEQLRGGAVDARTDIFALGCVLHFSLTGRSANDRSARGIEGSVPEDVARIIRRATLAQPESRHESADVLGIECREALHARLDRDAKSFVRAWLRRIRPQLEGSPSESADISGARGTESGPRGAALFDASLIPSYEEPAPARPPTIAVKPVPAAEGLEESPWDLAPTEVDVEEDPFALAPTTPDLVPNASIATESKPFAIEAKPIGTEAKRAPENKSVAIDVDPVRQSSTNAPESSSSRSILLGTGAAISRWVGASWRRIRGAKR